MKEAAKRDYKDEYKKFQSSDKSKKYRAELNKYNRDKGTYGNGDGKDASHKGGKIAGFEKESVNRGRAEKSRLKKTSENIDMNEQKLREAIRRIIGEDFAGSYPESKRKSFDGKRRKQSEVLGYKLTGVNDVKTEIDDATVKEGKLTESKFKDIDVKNMGKKKLNDLMIYLLNILDLGFVSDIKTDTKKRVLSVNVSKINPKSIENVKKRFGVDLTEGKLTEGGAQIAKTILQQLGGNKFIAMTGAKNLGHTNKGLQMKIGRNSKGITHVIINLKASDTYEMEFIKLRGASRKVVKKVSGVYNDMLGKIFTKYTGMHTRL